MNARVFALRPVFVLLCYLPLVPVDAGAFELLTVCPDGTGDFTTIQPAIDAAADGDTVELCDAIYSGENNRDLHLRGKEITVRSRGGHPEDCIIDCTDAPDSLRRGFIFEEGEGHACVLEGVTVQHAHHTSGGAAILVMGSDPTIRNCVFVDNTGLGGAALLADEGSAPVIEDCRFESNQVDSYGGACYLAQGRATLRRCWFLNNSSLFTGGAVLTYDDATRIEHCTFIGNTALNGGALGCYFPSDSLLVAHCTFYGNGAPSGGTLVTAYDANPTLEHCIVANGTQGAAVYCVQAAGATFRCSDIYGNAGGDWVGCIAGQMGVDGNFSADPLFCDAPSGDYTLAENSPCTADNSPAGCGLIGAHDVGCVVSGTPEVEATLPGTFYALPVAPNPFEGSAVIRYGIPSTADGSRVVVAIHDLEGRWVTTLLDAEQPAGHHRVIWDGRAQEGQPVPGGVYFYRVTWDGQTQAQRMMFLK